MLRLLQLYSKKISVDKLIKLFGGKFDSGHIL